MAAADPVPTDARERRDVVVPVPGPEDPPERAWLVLPHRHPVPTLLDETRDAVVGLAETLAAVLPVTVLAHPRDAGAARLVPPEVDLLRAPVGSPLLGRTGPSFIRRPEGLAAVAWRSAAGLTGTGPLDGAAATAVAMRTWPSRWLPPNAATALSSSVSVSRFRGSSACSLTPHSLAAYFLKPTIRVGTAASSRESARPSHGRVLRA